MPATKHLINYLAFTICTCCYASLDRDIVLRFQPGSQVLNQLSLSTGGSDQGTIFVSGTQSANIRFDESSLEPISFTFTGNGRAFRTDMNLSLTSFIRISDEGTVIGTFQTTIDVSTRNNSYVTNSNTSPAFVNPVTGALDNAQHHDLYDQGTATITISLLGESFPEVVNFQQQPTTIDFEGTNLIKIEREPSTSPLDQTLKVTLSSNFDTTSSELLEDTNARLNTREVGTLTSVGITTIPTPYSQWLINMNTVADTGYELNRSGIPYYLLYVLDLPIDTNQLPIAFERGSPNCYAITLPSAGLKEELTIETSTTLEVDSWTPVDQETFLDPSSSLAKGSTGTVRIKLNNLDPTFLRLAADPSKQTSTSLSP